jgi:hypothetical protein
MMVALRHHHGRKPIAPMSKLYSAFLVITSVVAMAALGVLILVIIADISQLAVSAGNPFGMKP